MRPTRYRGAVRPSPRTRRAAKPLLDGQVRCEECRSGVRLRDDGLMRAHRVDGYPCLASSTDRYLDSLPATT